MDVEPESGAAQHDLAGSGEAPLACTCCRRRKLRCSREAPACQQCRKIGTDCVYDTKRAKPGMKSGAIETIHRRLDVLERALNEKRSLEKTSHDEDHDSSASTAASTAPAKDPETERSAYSILSFLARELQSFNSRQTLGQGSLSQLGSHSQIDSAFRGAKRRRTNNDANSGPGARSSSASIDSALERNQEAVMKAYFTVVHPWIPMLHEGRLLRRLHESSARPSLQVLLRAMVLVAARFVENPSVAAVLVGSKEDELDSRDWVVCNAMRKPSVESIQALVMISFNDIGCGVASRAWAIVGSLTRMVEYLQLAHEHEETDRISLSQPYISLSPAEDWTEAEERRRVFWNVFSLDRFCSVTMGWNTSLTSDDVNRRLPCDGISWRKEDPVNTPYFGIWDKAEGRIGNPIAFIPSHYAPPYQLTEEDAQTPSEAGTSPVAPPATIDMSTVGAFAYSIEATESLSRVTTYFLQQKVNMRDPRDLSSWLTRFKELDLRLVHWKMLLPQKWKVNMARQSCRMDPNLTLAHVTHNASMILLHQLIAFPSVDWAFRNRLPSLCSVDTCQAAAVEIATITQNYLRNAPSHLPVASQFAFCVYIASRVLLIHWRYNERPSLDPEFWSLVKSLDAMAESWAGPHSSNPQTGSIAAKYSQTLLELHGRCSRDASFRIPVLQYTTETNHSSPTTSDDASEHYRMNKVNEHDISQGEQPQDHLQQPRLPQLQNIGVSNMMQAEKEATAVADVNDSMQTQAHFQNQVIPIKFTTHPDSIPSPVPGPGPEMMGVEATSRPGAYHRSAGSVGSGELNAISQMLLGQQFMDMDRVISYDDGVFGEYDGGGW